MSVLVVDDHVTFTGLLKVAIDLEPDLEWAGAATNLASALALMAVQVPDLVVMDYQLGADEVDGVAATAAITRRHPEVRVVMLTGHAREDLVQQAARAGACSLMPKSGRLAELLTCLRTASHGGFVVHPALLKTLIIEQPADTMPRLSPREGEVLQLLADGFHVSSIAEQLGISPSTCRGYVQSLLMKLGAHTRLEAVAVARRMGLTSAAGLGQPA